MDKTDAVLMDILKQNQSLVEQYINKRNKKNIDYEGNFEKISKKIYLIEMTSTQSFYSILFGLLKQEMLQKKFISGYIFG